MYITILESQERLIQFGSRVEYLELRDLQHEISPEAAVTLRR